MVKKIIHYAKFPFLKDKHSRVKTFILSIIYSTAPILTIYSTYKGFLNYDPYVSTWAVSREIIRTANLNLLYEIIYFLSFSLIVPLIFAFVSYLIEPYFKKS